MSDEFTAGGCNPSDCASCGGGCSSAGGCDPVENHKTITLTMEDDTEVECAILTIFPVDAKEYAKAAVAFDTVLQNAKDSMEKID